MDDCPSPTSSFRRLDLQCRAIDAFHALGALRNGHRLVHQRLRIEQAGQRHDAIGGTDIDIESLDVVVCQEIRLDFRGNPAIGNRRLGIFICRRFPVIGYLCVACHGKRHSEHAHCKRHEYGAF